MKNKFNYFKDVEDYKLRIWNLSVTAHNLYDDFGGAVLEDYMSGIEQKDLMIISMVFANLHKHGIDKTRLMMLEGVEYSDDKEIEFGDSAENCYEPLVVPVLEDDG